MSSSHSSSTGFWEISEDLTLSTACFGQGAPGYVLVEEDPAIRHAWLMLAESRGLPLAAYASVEALLVDLPHFGDETCVFISYQLETAPGSSGLRRGGGLDVARKLRHGAASPAVKTAVILLTDHPKRLFEKELGEGVVDDVRSRSPFSLLEQNSPLRNVFPIPLRFPASAEYIYV